jgi:hypothetical protein
VTRRKSPVVKRFSILVGALAAGLLAGWGAPAGARVNPALGLVRAGQDIVVKDVSIRATMDSVAATNDQYLIVTFAFTNHTGNTLAPKIDHFAIEDDQKRRFLGADSGSPALIGLSNFPGQLKIGESHDYTVGFRVPLNTQGTLFYDSTF